MQLYLIQFNAAVFDTMIFNAKQLYLMQCNTVLDPPANNSPDIDEQSYLNNSSTDERSFY